MCWPLSRSTPSMLTRRARPPKLREASKTVTGTPRSASVTAAARPDQPAPMTAMRFVIPAPHPDPLPRWERGKWQSRRNPGPPRDPELAARRERGAPLEHLEAVAGDLVEQRPVDSGHHEARPLRMPVFGRQERERLVVAAHGALGLELHQPG